MIEAGSQVVHKPTGLTFTVIALSQLGTWCPFAWCKDLPKNVRQPVVLHQLKLIQQGDVDVTDKVQSTGDVQEAAEVEAQLEIGTWVEVHTGNDQSNHNGEVSQIIAMDDHTYKVQFADRAEYYFRFDQLKATTVPEPNFKNGDWVKVTTGEGSGIGQITDYNPSREFVKVALVTGKVINFNIDDLELTTEPKSKIDPDQFADLSIDDLDKLKQQVEIAAYLRWKNEVEKTDLVAKCRDCWSAFGVSPEDNGKKIVWKHNDMVVEVSANQATVTVNYKGEVVLDNNRNRGRGVYSHGQYLPGEWLKTINEMHPAALQIIIQRRDQQVALLRKSKITELVCVLQEFGFTQVPTLPEPKFGIGDWVKVMDDDTDGSYFNDQVGQVTGYEVKRDYYQVAIEGHGVVQFRSQHLKTATAPVADEPGTVMPVDNRYDLYCTLFREKPACAAYIAEALLTFHVFHSKTTTLMIEVMQDKEADIDHREVAAKALSRMEGSKAVAALLDALAGDDTTLSEIAAFALAAWEKTEESTYP